MPRVYYRTRAWSKQAESDFVSHYPALQPLTFSFLSLQFTHAINALFAERTR